jgi:hypothetical protein
MQLLTRAYGREISFVKSPMLISSLLKKLSATPGLLQIAGTRCVGCATIFQICAFIVTVLFSFLKWQDGVGKRSHGLSCVCGNDTTEARN